jgi:hypothetical protein
MEIERSREADAFLTTIEASLSGALRSSVVEENLPRWRRLVGARYWLCRGARGVMLEGCFGRPRSHYVADEPAG